MFNWYTNNTVPCSGKPRAFYLLQITTNGVFACALAVCMMGTDEKTLNSRSATPLPIKPDILAIEMPTPMLPHVLPGHFPLLFEACNNRSMSHFQFLQGRFKFGE